MPILGAAIMDTERIIPQNGSSPGSSGSSNGGVNPNHQQSSHMLHNSSNHLHQAQQMNYSQHTGNNTYHHQQYVNGHTTANMLQSGGVGQSNSPIQLGNPNATLTSTANLNTSYTTMTVGGLGGGNIMRKKKSERLVPLPPTSSTTDLGLVNYNPPNGIVGSYSNNTLTNSVTISNQNQFVANNHTINTHGQGQGLSSHATPTSHPPYGGHNYGSDMNGSHPLQTKSGAPGSAQIGGGILNHAYTRDNR